MALLDRFRTLPSHKDPDPAVRLAFIEELPIDERDRLTAAARGDEDPRVRRAAVAKLMDPAALAAVARDDVDEGVRDQANAMLRDIALEAFEGTGVAESLAAVDAIADVRALARIAKTATREDVARTALARISDVRIVGSIAGHAALEPTRRAAFGLLQEQDELVAVAMNGDFKDTAIAAVERLSARADLEQIAARSKNKNAARRARSILRERDARAAAEASVALLASPDPAATAPGESVRIVQRLEALPSLDVHAAEPALHEAEAQWVSVGPADSRARALDEAARQGEPRQAAGRAEAQAVADQEATKERERRRLRVGELVQQAEAAVSAEDLRAARRRLAIVLREWTDLTAGAAVGAEIAARLAEAATRLHAREREAQEAEARVRRDGLNRMHQLLGRVEPLVARQDLSWRAAERALRDIRTTLAALPPLPSRREHDEVVRRLKAALATLTPKMQELRDIYEWQRWANIGIQEQLCHKMEALKAIEDPEEIALQIRALQQQWRQAADVPREQGDLLWRRFKAAHDEVWARCEAHFAAQAEERAASLAKKVALCERAEALADSTNWIQTANEMKRLQADWKTIGSVPRGQEEAIWRRFRGACDRFFTRRQQDLVRRKAVWGENLAKKVSLCTKAEALVYSSEWDLAAAEVKRLQAEWRTIGPVKRARSEALWQRFHGACDRFFVRYAQRHDIARAERVTAREGICAELEELARPEDVEGRSEDPPAELLTKVRALRSRWQQEIVARGVDRECALALDQRFLSALARVVSSRPAVFGGTDLDPDANRTRMESLVRRMEDLAASLAGPMLAQDGALAPTAGLAAMLKEALAANTIGGKVDEESRRRAAQEDVRQAQANWSRIGPVRDEIRRPLADRFDRACRWITKRGTVEAAGRLGRPGGPGR